MIKFSRAASPSRGHSLHCPALGQHLAALPCRHPAARGGGPGPPEMAAAAPPATLEEALALDTDELKEIAEELGVPEEEVEDADEADDIKAALFNLIVEHSPAPAP
eukprot:SAG22_NODE_15904_length_337_cov_0.873950_1_plen_105_part_10